MVLLIKTLWVWATLVTTLRAAFWVDETSCGGPEDPKHKLMNEGAEESFAWIGLALAEVEKPDMDANVRELMDLLFGPAIFDDKMLSAKELSKPIDPNDPDHSLTYDLISFAPDFIQHKLDFNLRVAHLNENFWTRFHTLRPERVSTSDNSGYTPVDLLAPFTLTFVHEAK
ncbi:hypothetical protein G7Z17_g1583 [Cylindrodendrum hubeiense]|uniref:Uncharacterized protein n=1 Tax=Cylindrodendrum hubeiense TaxID=595255 RepID=A0A9P5HEI8_9HYPO|nr:hypothetical protein G7Z17_g1583 [Cylindrodendrum hubeiense]